jgi:hypothetical protein
LIFFETTVWIFLPFSFEGRFHNEKAMGYHNRFSERAGALGRLCDSCHTG